MQKLRVSILLVAVLLVSEVAAGLLLRSSPANAEVGINPATGTGEACNHTITNAEINGAGGYTISSAGVYCLADNLYDLSGKAGYSITISSGPTILDFGGYSLATMTTGMNIRAVGGVKVTGGADYVVRNGSIFGYELGITADGGANLVIEKMIIDHVNTAISLTGNMSGPVVVQDNLFQHFAYGIDDLSLQSLVVKNNVFSYQDSLGTGGAVIKFGTSSGHGVVERNQFIDVVEAIVLFTPPGMPPGPNTQLIFRYNSALNAPAGAFPALVDILENDQL